MPLDIWVVRTSDFIQVSAKGETDLARSKAGLSKMAAECVARGVPCALLDAREAPGSLTITELYELACSFHEMGFRPEHRVAILHKQDAGERAKFFADCASNRGWNIRAFDSFEKVFEWFSAREKVREEAQEPDGTTAHLER